MRKRLKKGGIRSIGTIRHRKKEGEQPALASAGVVRQERQDTIKLGGLPEEIPNKEKPSEWLKDEKRPVDEDVGGLLDEFAHFSRIAEGGLKEESSGTTLPPSRQRFPCTHDRCTHSRKTN